MLALPVDAPPEEQFWERYNKRLEFPLSTAVTVLIHALVAGLLVLVLSYLMNGSKVASAVPVSLVEVVGQDDDGDGSAGSSRVENPIGIAPTDPWQASLALLPSPADLPKVEAEIRKLLEDPERAVAISPANGAQYDQLDETLRKKLLQEPGGNKGAGGANGKGDTKQAGNGPGGFANDSRSRSLRWVLRFTTMDGQDYLDQLAAMGAVILIPLPPENKECLYFPNLKKLGERRLATEGDLKKLAGQVRFSDARPESVRAVCEALGVKEKARTFWAFFPKGLEDELARKEMGYRNRRPEDVAETVFRITLRDGKAEITVVDQSAK